MRRHSSNQTRTAPPQTGPQAATPQSAYRRAFTLVELLVVIAIIGTLVGLLLPAVQSARESARNNTCKNNIRNLALAMTQFDSARGELPGYVNSLEDPNNELLGRRASWLVMLFPHLENGALWESWSRELFEQGMGPERWTNLPNSGTAPQLEIAECPSDPAEGEGFPFLSYVINAGMAFDDTTRQTPAVTCSNNDTVGAPICIQTEYIGNGVSFDLATNTAIIPNDAIDDREGQRRLNASIDYVQTNDGTSRTMMFSENIHAVFWAYDGDADEALDNSLVPDTKHLFGFTWHNAVSGDADQRRINGSFNVLPPETMANLASRPELGYPNSQHPSGVNTAFCDGRVVFLNDNINNRIYSQLMTSNRKRSRYFNGDGPDRNLGQPADNDF